MPESSEKSLDELYDMLVDVNDKFVRPEERLSYKILHYYRNECRLENAREWAGREAAKEFLRTVKAPAHKPKPSKNIGLEL